MKYSPLTLTDLTTRSGYHSPERPTPGYRQRYASLFFYARIANIIWQASRLARKGAYSGEVWAHSGIATIDALESVGCQFIFENLDIIRQLKPPCVFIGNHMSVLETFILPCLISPYFKVTFVVKESLVAYPVFKHAMRSGNPIVVGRDNPRKDLGIVLKEGQKKLNAGISIIIFPQTTRTVEFDPKQFNTLGIKLAKRGNVPVIPLALKTDAWGMGRRFKDAGSIQPEKSVYICFGKPIQISGSGKLEHRQVVDFITAKLQSWQNQPSSV